MLSNTHIRINDLRSLATIPLIFVFYFFYDIAYTPLLVSYTLEILPYRIRAKGFAVMVREEIRYRRYLPAYVPYSFRI